MRSCVALIAVVLPLVAQDQPPAPPQPAPPPPLENTGKPIVVPFQCTDEDIRVAGLSCTDEEPCPVYLEISSFASTGIRLFAAGNLHTANATLFSILLGSEDNGHTWREAHERIRQAELDHIQFSGAESGWVSGLELSPLPRDPFLLRTDDGGKTWRRSPIFSESGFGSIQQFYFEDPKTGTAIIDRGPGSGQDRYERYETPDGGDSWSVKETNVKPLSIKRAPPATAADWRVRADANSHSFHLEQRQGSRWTSLAAFAVNAGVCRPQPQ